MGFQVGIIMGSSSDARIMKEAAVILDEFDVKHDDQIISAHRTPTRIPQYVEFAQKNNIKVIIAGAGGAAHLPGMISSHTVIPVIGVPILIYNDKHSEKTTSAFGGLDSLLSISEMPTGSPVATVGINKSANAGLFALRILGIESASLAEKLNKYVTSRFDSVVEESTRLQSSGLSDFNK
ncbi:MAG: 5-(carboxyamino)imidazole ribonucleotide mutase [Candidatus Nitrosoabyssus spongiisocia]|nr:MAG: 5-(carboxyamino)imidazole ribonucleotide mutase [Nitrosopumilaceae archaeon AB1(1)]